MNRQKREQQILDSALKVFARQGYAHTNVSDLVKEAGVSRGTFYLYFKSKNEIFDCLIERFMGDVLRYISQFDASHSLEKQFQDNSLCHELSVCFTKYRLLARIIIVNARGLDGSHRLKINAYMKQLYRVLEHAIQHGVRSGAFKHVDTSVISHCLVGAIKEFLLEWTDQDQSFDLEQKITGLIEFTFNNLAVNNPTHVQDSHTPLDQQKDYLEAHS